MKVQNLLTLAVTSSLISTASAIIVMDYVTIGNPGNAADPLNGYGSVGYEYQIGKYEVTNAQYGAFLNAVAKTDSYGLYNSNMSSYGITQSGSSGSFTYTVTGGAENKPVLWVSWFDAARFSNWLNNGQGSGSTEDGAYSLLGATSGIITKNTGAQVYIPTENEWYKAAYYNGSEATYSLYPNGQNSISTGEANYAISVGTTTDVGSYSAYPSPYGTFDQGGNAFEWNDAVISGSSRGLRGGSWNNFADHFDGGGGLISTNRSYTDPSGGDADFFTGFRVAAVPEPSALIFSVLASGVMIIRRKR
jgi:formylglycine-generating enzyme required for sulfatase activity